MARFFINRPIVAIVISIVTVLLGVVALTGLPVAQYPDIVPPTVQVSASLVGASAADVETSVAAPLEQQINGVENMIYMKSTNSNDGSMSLAITFDIGTNLDTANVLTQNRVSQAIPMLPQSVKNSGVSVTKSPSFPLLIISIKSPKGTYDSDFLANYTLLNITNRLARTQGVGRVNMFGGSDYAMRIWLRPDRIARLGITVPDIANAIGEQNSLAPAGQIGGEPAPPGTEFTYAVRTRGRLLNEGEFGDIIVRSNADGTQVRLKDIARIEMGAQTYAMIGRHNAKPAAVVAVYQIPGTNALAVAKSAKETMAELSKQFPGDMDYAVSLDTTLPVEEGIKEIVTTLLEAVVLVVIVVFVFLQNWRATLIPLLTVPVSLVGAFIFFPLLGFSINVLSLLGLVLAIGIVVDDAIVVVEAVMHHIEQGLDPKAATIKAMEEVTGPVVAIALILAAVFVPVGFMGGVSGRLYQQFAITIAISVLLSAFNALTLSPALSALLLKPATGKKSLLTPFYRGFNRMFGAGTNAYVSMSGFLVRKLAVSAVLVGGLAFLTADLVKRVPQEFVPEEDQGYLLVNAMLPDAASLSRTDTVMRKAEQILAANPGVEGFNTITGFSMLSGAVSSNMGFFFVQLKPWHERSTAALHANGVAASLNAAFASQIPGAVVGAFGPPAIPGLGTGAGFTMQLQDTAGQAPEYLADQAQKFIQAASKRPEIANVSTVYRSNVPQVFADIDRNKVLKVGASLSDVNTTLGTLLGSSYVNDFNRFGRVYRVFMQAEPEFRRDRAGIGMFFVKTSQGTMVPLDTLVTMKDATGPEYTNRFNLFRAAEISGVAAPGYSSAQAATALKQVAAEVLPSDIAYDWSDMSYQEQKAPSPIPTFAVALLLVFLVLAAQYESWSLPFSVLLGTPFAGFGAFLGLWIARHFSSSYVNNVFTQIGLIMLIGLAAKNAILIVEFAKMLHEQGKDVVTAALEAARLRFRPILMTAFAFILGVVPLLRASGAGAESRKVMGMTVFSGMLIATILGVLLVPALYTMIGKLNSRSFFRRSGVVVALISLAWASTGCAAKGVNYTRPEMKPPAQYRGVSTSTAESLADLPWWQVWKDSQLQALVREAIGHNLDLRVAAARVVESRALAAVSKAYLYPEASVGISFDSAGKSRLGDPKMPVEQSPDRVFNNLSLEGKLSWELDLFGKLRRQHEAAFANYLSSEQGRRAVIVTLVGDVASKYLLLRELDVELAIARRTLKSNDDTVAYYVDRLNGGVSNRLEVDQAKANRATTASTIPGLERQIAQTEHSLCALLGRPPGPISRSATDEDMPAPAIPAGLPAQLLERRPDVVEAEQLLVAANANVGAAKAMFYPTISLTGTAGAVSGSLGDFLRPDSMVWSLGSGLLQPLFNAGRLKRNYEVERARFDQALATYQKAALDAYRDVADAVVSVEKYKAQSDELRLGVEALRDAVTLSRARYETGLAGYLEVLTADQTLFQQEIQLAQARGEQWRAVALLYRALGGGWQAETGG